MLGGGSIWSESYLSRFGDVADRAAGDRDIRKRVPLLVGIMVIAKIQTGLFSVERARKLAI